LELCNNGSWDGCRHAYSAIARDIMKPFCRHHLMLGVDKIGIYQTRSGIGIIKVMIWIYRKKGNIKQVSAFYRTELSGLFYKLPFDQLLILYYHLILLLIGCDHNSSFYGTSYRVLSLFSWHRKDKIYSCLRRCKFDL